MASKATKISDPIDLAAELDKRGVARSESAEPVWKPYPVDWTKRNHKGKFVGIATSVKAVDDGKS